MTGQCDFVRKDVFLGKGWRRQKPNRNFMQYGTDDGAM